jgi:signal transduction histidine kinase
MCTRDQWPYVPDRLRDFIDQENLAALEAGLSERMGRPVTLLDYDPPTGGFVRIESIRERQRYEPFCKLLRDEDLVAGGDRKCKTWDIDQAAASLAHYRAKGELFRQFPCCMGLIDMTHIVRIKEHPVAILITGQYRPSDGPEPIEQAVEQLGKGAGAQVTLTEGTRQALRASIVDLPEIPDDIQQRMETCSNTIQRIAEAEFEMQKARWEQSFLDELRDTAIAPTDLTLATVRRQVGQMMAQIVKFCHCEYAIFFGSYQEGATVLAPVAHAGLPDEIAGKLPHFNWRKAELSPRTNHVEGWTLSRGDDRVGKRGIRGDNNRYFANASCIAPTALGDRYLGVLILGPTPVRLDFDQERRFLNNVAGVVGLFALTGLEVLFLERERRRLQSTAMLLTHQLRTALTPIVSQTGFAKALVEAGIDGNAAYIIDLLGRVEDLAMRVARRSRQTLEGHVLQIESEDLEIERHPLSVLVSNCASVFDERARKQALDLVIGERVELLPEADVDVARFTIALANLLDNAIKYSFPNTKIYVRARYDIAEPVMRANAMIEVDNLGIEISGEDQERIFEQGTRGLTAAKMGHVEGSGLGLWEARAIAVAHGGDISMRCDRTNRRTSRGQTAYHIVFTITIPLRQPD